jgi:hypothetical protein
MSEAQLFRPRRSYALMAGLGGLVALLFAWELYRTFSAATLFFLLIALYFFVVNLRWAVSSVALTPTGLLCHRPFVAPLSITFRQIATCEESGRMGKGISLIFYPLADNGLIDLDRPTSCFLPGVEGQRELLESVQGQLVD